MSDLIAGLTAPETMAYRQLRSQLDEGSRGREGKLQYLEGRQTVRPLAGHIPDHVIAQANVSVPWASIAVGTICDRLDLITLGATLDPVFRALNLRALATRVHYDALLYGTSFVRVERGSNAFEPPVVVTAHSAMTCTAVWDYRQSRCTAALTVVSATQAILDVLGATITLARTSPSAAWVAAKRDDHGFPYLPVVRFVNEHRSGAMDGQSEVSRSLRSAIDGACNVLLTLAANRLAYSAPQLMMIGASPDNFRDPTTGRVQTAWQTVTGRMLILDRERDEAGNLVEGATDPTVQQLEVASPGPLLEQLNSYAKQAAAASGIPESMFGVTTTNPASADAIRAQEAPLVRHVQRCQGNFGWAWYQVGELVCLLLNAPIPADLSAGWADPGTQTRAATADEVVKLVGATVLPPTSRPVLDRLGFTREQQDQIAADRAEWVAQQAEAAAAQAVAAQIAAAGPAE